MSTRSQTTSSASGLSLSLWKEWKGRTKSRVCCRGHIVTGPSHEQAPALLINLAILFGIASESYLMVVTDYHPFVCTSKIITITFTIDLALGIISIFFAWRTQFRDPGILDPYGDYTSIQT